MPMLDKRCASSDESDENSAQYSQSSDSEGEVALDLDGRAHVDRQNNADGVYWSRADSRSVYTTFPMPGKVSADAFRKFLGGQLREELITDAYGVVTGIEDVADDYLPVLQAKMWREKCADQDSRTTQREQSASPEDDVLLTQRILDIVELLYSNHIFVLPTSNKGTCSIATSLVASHGATTPPQIVALEPLIHWGTVTPATDVPLADGKILAFRRNGEKCDDPLWTMAIQRLIPKDPLTFCIECLGVLMGKHAETCAPTENSKIREFHSVNAHHVYKSAANRRRLGRIHTENDGRDAVPSISRDVGSAEAYENECQPAPMAALQLDGTFEMVTPVKQGLPKSSTGSGTPSDRRSSRCSAKQTTSSIERSSTSLGRYESLPSKGSRYRCGSFTPLSAMSIDGVSTPCEHTDSFPCITIRSSPSTPSKSSGGSTVISLETQPLPLPHINEPKPLKSSTDTLQSPKREFGRVIDPNIQRPLRFTPNTKERMFEQDKSPKGVADNRLSFSQPPTSLPDWAERALQKAKAHTQNFQPAASSADHDSIMSDLTSAGSTVIEDLKRSFEHNPDPPKLPKLPRKIKPLPKKKSPARPKTDKPIVEPAKPKEQAPFAPLYAKHALAAIRPEDVPEGVSIYTYLDYVKRVPSTSAKICSCHQAARTPDVKIAQCANKDCFIGWYHYDCLDKSAKISARFGTMICQQCKSEKDVKEMGEQNKFNIEELVAREMGANLKWTKEEVLAALPGPGGFAGVKDPYGLCALNQQAPAAPSTADRDTLGSLSASVLADSRPHLLNEAYNNAQVHKAAADARFKGQQEVEDDVHYGEENDSSEDADESMGVEE